MIDTEKSLKCISVSKRGSRRETGSSKLTTSVFRAEKGPKRAAAAVAPSPPTPAPVDRAAGAAGAADDAGGGPRKGAAKEEADAEVGGDAAAQAVSWFGSSTRREEPPAKSLGSLVAALSSPKSQIKNNKNKMRCFLEFYSCCVCV